MHFGEYSRTHVLVRLARLTNIRHTVLPGLARLADIRQTVLSGLAKLVNGECEYSSPREWPLVTFNSINFLAHSISLLKHASKSGVALYLFLALI